MSARDIVAELRDHQNGGRRAECEAAAAEIEWLRAVQADLLEALRGLDEAYCRADQALSRAERAEDRKRLIAARAAIAKATGDAQ